MNLDESRTFGSLKAFSEDLPSAVTDVGCERDINEDRYAVVESPNGRAWVVCDGMGGVAGGELASQLAIESIRRTLENGIFDSAEIALQSAMLEANRIIVLRKQNPNFKNMGTTVVAANIFDHEVIIASAGDSRAYVLSDGKLRQLTVDHTYVQELVNKGLITEEEAFDHPQAHVLTRCLGSEVKLNLDVKKHYLWESELSETHDKLVLCSDGLYSLVSDNEMSDIIEHFSPQEACSKLVELARSRGGYDNITLVILPLGGRLKDVPPTNYKPKKPSRDQKISRQVPKIRFTKRQKIALALFSVTAGLVVSVITIVLKLASIKY